MSPVHVLQMSPVHVLQMSPVHVLQIVAKIEKIYINVVVYKTIFHERFYFWYIF